MKTFIARIALAGVGLFTGAVLGLPEAQSSPLEAIAAVEEASDVESLATNQCADLCRNWCATGGGTCTSWRANPDGGCSFTCSVAKEKLPKPSEEK